MILSLAADHPLLHVPTSTPLEINHGALVTSLAHEARVVMSVRPLETGAARDVSGVLRITRGGSAEDEEEAFEEKEALYYVGNDGSVRMFESRAGMGDL